MTIQRMDHVGIVVNDPAAPWRSSLNSDSSWKRDADRGPLGGGEANRIWTRSLGAADPYRRRWTSLLWTSHQP